MLLWNRADVWGNKEGGRGRWSPGQPFCLAFRRYGIYLLLKDESHGEGHGLEQQQHAEDAEKLQGGNQERSQSRRTEGNVQARRNANKRVEATSDEGEINNGFKSGASRGDKINSPLQESQSLS